MSDTNTNKGVLDAEENKVNLVKISACISQKIDTVIRDMADEYGVSFSEVLRLVYWSSFFVTLCSINTYL